MCFEGVNSNQIQKVWPFWLSISWKRKVFLRVRIINQLSPSQKLLRSRTTTSRMELPASGSRNGHGFADKYIKVEKKYIRMAGSSFFRWLFYCWLWRSVDGFEARVLYFEVLTSSQEWRTQYVEKNGIAGHRWRVHRCKYKIDWTLEVEWIIEVARWWSRKMFYLSAH